MKKFSVDPRDFLESDIHWLPSKIVSRISNIAGNLLNDEWESGIASIYHESYVENEKIILEFDDDSLSGWQEFGIFDKFKKCCKKAFRLYLEDLLKEEIKNAEGEKIIDKDNPTVLFHCNCGYDFSVEEPILLYALLVYKADCPKCHATCRRAIEEV